MGGDPGGSRRIDSTMYTCVSPRCGVKSTSFRSKPAQMKNCLMSLILLRSIRSLIVPTPRKVFFTSGLRVSSWPEAPYPAKSHLAKFLD